MSVRDMIQEARALAPNEFKQLMRALVDLMPDTANTTHRKRSILEFEGIAAPLADGEYPQALMTRLRSEWDAPT